MTRVFAVAALIGCACGQSAAHAPATTCPDSPTVPTVNLSLCPVERPSSSLAVTEPPDDSALLRGNGFWCTAFLAGKWTGESYCFRRLERCEEWKRRYRQPDKTSECRRVERASCVKILDYTRMGMFFLCVPLDRCEAFRHDLVTRLPDRGVGECRDLQ